MDTADRVLEPVRRVFNIFHRDKKIRFRSPNTSKAQERAANAPFAFEKLPYKIRSKIVRFIIPSIGSCSVGKRLGVSKEIRQRQWTIALEEHTRFVNICLVNHWMLSEVRAILHREVFYGFNEYLHQAKGPLCQPRLGPHVHFMQCYHINFLCVENDIARARCYTNAMARNVIRGYLEFIRHLVKADRGIRRLKLTLPCLQTLPSCESTILDETENVDFLSPLKYLRVTEPILFEFVNNTGLPKRSQACPYLKCEDMLKNIRAKFARLEGERISFDEVAIETEAFIREKHRKWKQQRSTTVGRIMYDMDDVTDDLAWQIKAATQRR